jgi:hypothetical protein
VLRHTLFPSRFIGRGVFAAVLSFLFQIFARRAKIWKNKWLRTLLPQANPADDDTTA